MSNVWVVKNTPDSKVHGANMGPTWVLSAPDGPHAGPMNFAIRDTLVKYDSFFMFVAFMYIQHVKSF